MTADQSALLDKAQHSLHAAHVLQKEGELDFATSRAYYCMFYASQALLLSRGLSFSSHAAVIAAFGKELVKSGAVPNRYHSYIIDAADARNIGDYQLHRHVQPETTSETIAHGEEFLAFARDFLANS